jgi:formate dehydrogenase beta subunit
MDCARSALRLGAGEVHVIYRREREDMPADPKEVEDAMHEGVVFHFLTHPKRLISEEGAVKAMELVLMKKSEPDEHGRRTLYPHEGSEWIEEFDLVISAIGQQVDPAFLSADDAVKLGRWGEIDVDPDTLKTSLKGVFAGGDCATGPATLIQAMSQGLKASKNISDYLTHGRTRFYPLTRMRQLVNTFEKTNQDWVEIPILNQYRVQVKELDPEQRKAIFAEVEKPITLDEAYHEASRCMRCYRIYSIITER